MRIHADFTETVALDTEAMEWVVSPMAGVERRMLDRIGGEVARATSLVRYAPGSRFSPHTHDGGEEFLVLSGVFSDEHGDFPAGSYIRNPPTSSHAPRSRTGCVIFVKLHQFDPSDRTHVRIDTRKMRAVADATRPGASLVPLFADGREDVRLERWAPNARTEIDGSGGVELFVLQGSFEWRGDTHATGHWLRSPPGREFVAQAGADGAEVWVKTGHLEHDPTGVKRSGEKIVRKNKTLERSI